MSTIKVTNIEHASTANGGIQLDNAGHVTVDGQQMPTAGALSNRNLIINGAMNVAQRGTSTTGVGTAVAYNTVDRWRFADSQDPSARYTETQSTDAPDGFSNSRKFEVTTADTNVEADEMQYTDHFIESQNLQHLAYGTSAAKKITLSFYVKSSVAQTFGVGLQLHDGSESHYGVSYTVNSANTWEYKTITFNGNTSLSIDNDNGRGMRIRFGLAVGSDFVAGSDATAWDASGSQFGQHSNTWVGTSGATWQLTGVQLEVGEKATPFEHRSYGDELARCQRYFRRLCEGASYAAAPGSGTGTSSTNAWHNIHLIPEMRTVPTLADFSNLRNDDVSGGTAVTALSLTTSMSSTEAVFLQATSASGLTAHRPYFLLANNTSSAKLDLSAEL